MDVKKEASYLLLASFMRVLAAMQHGSGGIPLGAFASFVTFVSLWALVALLTLASFLSFLPFICNVSISQSRSTLAFPRIFASRRRRGAPVRVWVCANGRAIRIAAKHGEGAQNPKRWEDQVENQMEEERPDGRMKTRLQGLVF